MHTVQEHRTTSLAQGDNEEIEHVLRLNVEVLVSRRREELDALQRHLRSRHGVNDLPVPQLKKLRAQYDAQHPSVQRPFVGYLCWWLDRAIEKRSGRT